MEPTVFKEAEDSRLAEVGLQRPVPGYGLDGLLGYWTAEYFTAANPSGAGDWDATFDDVSNDRRIDYIVTAGGRLSPQIVGGTDDVARFRIAFWNEGPPYSVSVAIRADTFGRIQYKVNGELSNLVASATATWTFRTGPNEVQISIGEGAERLTFIGRLFDGRYSKWMDADFLSGWDRR
jgi:hypothetical protein